MDVRKWFARRAKPARNNSPQVAHAAVEPLEPRLLLAAVPDIVSLGLSANPIVENDSVTLTGTFTDADMSDTHFVTIDWGDGTSTDTIFFPMGTRDFSRAHQYLDDSAGTPTGAFTISATVNDGTDSDTDTVDLTVQEAAPPEIVSLALDWDVIDENGTVNLTGSFTDLGALDVHTVEVDWGDGSIESFVLVVGERSFARSHQYLDDDPTGTPSDDYQIAVSVTDDTGGSDSSNTSVTVNNVAPDIGTLSLDSLVIDENDTATLTGSFTDPGTLDEHTIQIDWGDGASESLVLAVGERSFESSHQYLDDDPTGTPSDDYQISVTVTDDDSGADDDGTTITVNNVPPVIVDVLSSAGGVGDAAEGEEVTISGSFTDVGTLDTHTAEIDWGDGTVTSGLIAQAAGSGTFEGSHVYEYGGIYTITVTVLDDDLGEDTATAAAVISGAGVHDGVLQIIGTRDRDRAKVNQQGNGLLKVHANFLREGERHRTFESEGVERIEILLGDGNDRAQISGNIDLLALIDGGAGNDKMKAGRGAAVLLGGEGKDKLIGGKGNDIMIGGEGKDRLVGGPGDDILIGGTTAFDIDDDALTGEYNVPLLALLAEWDSERDYDTRVSNLDGTGTGPRLNEDYFLQEGITVFDDGMPDRLTGSSGQNWVIEPLDAKALRRLQRQQEREARKAARELERQARQQAHQAGPPEETPPVDPPPVDDAPGNSGNSHGNGNANGHGNGNGNNG